MNMTKDEFVARFIRSAQDKELEKYHTLQKWRKEVSKYLKERSIRWQQNVKQRKNNQQ